MLRSTYCNTSRLVTSVLSSLILLVPLCGSSCSPNNEQIDTDTQIVLIADGNFMYPAKVTKPYTDTDTEVHIYIFNTEVRESVGNRVPRKQIAVTRKEPAVGWGNRKVILDYYSDGDWIYIEGATEFLDHYTVPDNAGNSQKIALSDVRFSIPRH